jgi:hypothetical protein
MNIVNNLSMSYQPSFFGAIGDVIDCPKHTEARQNELNGLFILLIIG